MVAVVQAEVEEVSPKANCFETFFFKKTMFYKARTYFFETTNDFLFHMNQK